ncbi:hypothetical protein EV126DRAFT_242515 [Verticillium dahliae]|nr:hypothetical protein EV126DRAFT_242515 [Verticillium dahliae]
MAAMQPDKPFGWLAPEPKRQFEVPHGRPRCRLQFWWRALIGIVVVVAAASSEVRNKARPEGLGREDRPNGHFISSTPFAKACKRNACGETKIATTWRNEVFPSRAGNLCGIAGSITPDLVRPPLTTSRGRPGTVLGRMVQTDARVQHNQLVKEMQGPSSSWLRRSRGL